MLRSGIGAGRTGSNPDQGTKIPQGARCGPSEKDDCHPRDLSPASPGWVPAGPQLLSTCVATVHGSSPFSNRKITPGLAASSPPVQGKWSLMLVSVFVGTRCVFACVCVSAVCLRASLRVGMCMCECVGVSVGVVCQAWVEATMGKIQLGVPRGCQSKYNFLMLFFFFLRMKFSQKSGPELGWRERPPPTKLKEALTYPHASYTT